jgi:hypothetical protein
LLGAFGANKQVPIASNGNKPPDLTSPVATDETAEAADVKQEGASFPGKTITRNADPRPPRDTLEEPQEIEAPRNLFRFPWRRAAPQPDSHVTVAESDRGTGAAEAEFIAPIKPLPGTPSVHETFVPVPSHGWLRGKNDGQPSSQKDKQTGSRNSSWMDRAEVERQIIGPRRKD